MVQPEKKRVLMLYKAMIPSVLLCGHFQLEELSAEGKIEYRHSCVRHVQKKDLDWAEIVLLCRLDDQFERELAGIMKKSEKNACICYRRRFVECTKHAEQWSVLCARGHPGKHSIYAVDE